MFQSELIKKQTEVENLIQEHYDSYKNSLPQVIQKITGHEVIKGTKLILSEYSYSDYRPDHYHSDHRHNVDFSIECYALKRLTDDLNKDTSQSNTKFHYRKTGYPSNNMASCHVWASFPELMEKP